MKRSVIQLAGRTLLVSLPAKWADANNVKKGNELDVVEDGHRLLINTESIPKTETVELNADVIGSLQVIRRYVFALYKKGIDEIKINYSDPNIADAIRDTILNETVGYEIISQTPKSCIVRLITSGNITEFDNLLRRAFLLLLTMSEETFESIKQNNFDHLAKTAMLERTNNRLTTICRRSLNKWGNEKYSKIGPLYYIVEEIENLGDEYMYLCNNLSRIKEKKNREINPEIISTLEKVNKSLREFYEIFYKFDVNKYDNIYKSRSEVILKLQDFIKTKKLTTAEFFLVHHSIIIMDKVFCVMGPQLVLIDGILK